MKLPEVIKLAVETADWELICKAYFGLTGETIVPPEPQPVEVDFADIDIDIGDLPSKIKSVVSDEMTKIRRKPGRPKKVAEVKQQDADAEPDEIEATGGSGVPIIAPAPPVDRNRKTIVGGQNRFFDAGLLPAHKKPTGSAPVIRPEDRVETGKMVEVECCLCEKKEVVPIQMSLGYVKKEDEKSNPNDPDKERLNRYKCNSCCSPRGREKVLRKIIEQEREGKKSASRFSR